MLKKRKFFIILAIAIIATFFLQKSRPPSDDEPFVTIRAPDNNTSESVLFLVTLSTDNDCDKKTDFNIDFSSILAFDFVLSLDFDKKNSKKDNDNK